VFINISEHISRMSSVSRVFEHFGQMLFLMLPMIHMHLRGNQT